MLIYHKNQKKKKKEQTNKQTNRMSLKMLTREIIRNYIIKLGEAFCISYRTDTLGRGMNPTILPPTISKQ